MEELLNLELILMLFGKDFMLKLTNLPLLKIKKCFLLSNIFKSISPYRIITKGGKFIILLDNLKEWESASVMLLIIKMMILNTKY
jgi:hypothetical protein